MRRVNPNILDDIDDIKLFSENLEMPARDGADLLGRAIGHEMAFEGHSTLRAGFAFILIDISPAFSQSQQWLTHTAISEVMIGA
jgi:hypothetical protein